MTRRTYESWGRYPKADHQVYVLGARCEKLPAAELSDKSLLPFGNGRSYGDVCLNDGGVLIDCRGLNRIISFDEQRGVLRCEAGVLLSEILREVVAKGWFLPVTPGTQFVTVGGAIANDVHGKNHHNSGTFGCHLTCFELLRSDGTRLVCSAAENPDFFGATIGGLGLTGVITWAEFNLKKIPSPCIMQEVVRFGSLDEFFGLSAASDRSFEYTVAWIDCLAKGPSLGRGLFMRGNHAGPAECPRQAGPRLQFTFPFDPPFTLVNNFSLRLFNSLYYRKQLRKRSRAAIHYAPFFYPLDTIRSWNRMYGSRGFLQYQCVVPFDNGHEAIKEILEKIASAGSGSFLAVLKAFGDITSPGLLSFPRPGVTLALDFPHRGQPTLDLLDRLDLITGEACGAVYPAKDARMSAASYRKYYPRWPDMAKFIDPRFSSSFWRRVTNPAET